MLRDLVKQGRLPHMEKLFFKQGTVWDGTTVFPSTTGPAYLPIVTGCFPGTCNVPGIRWIDRKHFDKGWNKLGTRSYVGYESFFFNDDISKDTKSLFEVFDDNLSIHNMVNRGVTKKSEPLKIFSSLLIFVAKLSHQWKIIDDLAGKISQRVLRKNMPKFSFITFLGVDEDSHLSSPFSEKTLRAYETVDKSVGKIIEILKEKNIYDQTLIFGSADHGLSDTKHHFELCDFVKNQGYKTFVYPKVYMKDSTAACMVSGNAMAHLYFKSGSSWEKEMFHEELTEKNLIQPLLEQESIDILISRTSKQSVMVNSKRGQAEISFTNDELHYHVHGTDPFGYPAVLSPKNSYYDATVGTDYPDAIMQAWQIMQASRAGDLIVTAKIGHDLRDRFEIPEHFASHGSFHREHMLVPILCNQKMDTAIPKRTVNIFPTILKLMGVNTNGIPTDGESFV